MKRIAALALLLLLPACKSDAERLNDLRTDEAVARLRVQNLEGELAGALRYNVDCSVSPAHQRECDRTDSLRTELHEARIQLDLAERDVRRFLE